jgi:pyruvoyl-dependent arginine decarboxylase (PvlArgDC)
VKKRMIAAAVGVEIGKRQPIYGHVYQMRAYKLTKGNHRLITRSEEEA